MESKAMNTQTQEALKMAIEALSIGYYSGSKFDEARNACKEALEQPLPEPVWFKDLSDEHQKQVYKVAKRMQKAIGTEEPTIVGHACILILELSAYLRGNI
jgi:hypothetical protein